MSFVLKCPVDREMIPYYSTVGWDDIPTEIYFYIFNKLDITSLRCCFTVSRKWREIATYICEEQYLWQALAEDGMVNHGVTQQLKSTLSWKDLYFNSLLWNRLPSATFHKLHEVEKADITNMHVYRDKVIVVNAFGVEYYDIESFQTIRFNPATFCLDVQESDDIMMVVTVMHSDVRYRVTVFVKLHKDEKVNVDNYLISLIMAGERSTHAFVDSWYWRTCLLDWDQNLKRRLDFVPSGIVGDILGTCVFRIFRDQPAKKEVVSYYVIAWSARRFFNISHYFLPPIGLSGWNEQNGAIIPVLTNLAAIPESCKEQELKRLFGNRVYVIDSSSVLWECSAKSNALSIKALAKFYGQIPTRSSTIHVLDEDVYVPLRLGRLVMVRKNSKMFRVVNTMEIPTKVIEGSNLNTGIPLGKTMDTFSALIKFPFGVEFIDKKLAPLRLIHYHYDDPDMTCAFQHGDVVFQGFVDGEISISLLRNGFKYNLNVQQFDQEEVKEPAVIAMDICEIKDMHKLFVATKHKLYFVLLTYPNDKETIEIKGS